MVGEGACMENQEIKNRNRTNNWMIQVGKYDWDQYSSFLLWIPCKMDDDTWKKSVTNDLEKGMNNTALVTITKIAAVYESS